MKFVALLFIFALAFAEVEMEDGVIVLNDDNFDEILSQHESLLVKFYAPVSSCSFILTDQWCGHCKKLAPEYAAAAKELATLDPPLYLAQVDATACPKLSQRFAIRGYPTLKFFKNGNAVDYDSGRSKQDIVNYMKKKSGPVAVAYNNKDDLETAIEAVDVAIVGFFENTESEEYQKWYAVMATLDDATAIYVTDADLAKDNYKPTQSICSAIKVTSSGSAVVFLNAKDAGKFAVANKAVYALSSEDNGHQN